MAAMLLRVVQTILLIHSYFLCHSSAHHVPEVIKPSFSTVISQILIFWPNSMRFYPFLRTKTRNFSSKLALEKSWQPYFSHFYFCFAVCVCVCVCVYVCFTIILITSCVFVIIERCHGILLNTKLNCGLGVRFFFV